MNKVSDNFFFTNSQLIKNQVFFFFQIIKHSNIKYIYTGLDKKKIMKKWLIFAYPSVFTCFGCSKELSH